MREVPISRAYLAFGFSYLALTLTTAVVPQVRHANVRKSCSASRTGSPHAGVVNPPHLRQRG